MNWNWLLGIMLFYLLSLKRILLIIAVSIASYDIVSGQEVTDPNQDGKKLFFGITSGINFSKFNGEDMNLGHFHSFDVTVEGKSTLGFTAGCFLELDISKRFSFQPAVNYNYTKHEIIYREWSRSGITGTVTDANFKVSYSRIKLSIPFKFSAGKYTRFGVLAGPYFDFPFLVKYDGNITTNVYSEQPPALLSSSGKTDDEISKDIGGGIGGLIGIRLDVPMNKNYICFEISLGKSLYYVVEMPDISESYISVNLVYLMKLK